MKELQKYEWHPKDFGFKLESCLKDLGFERWNRYTRVVDARELELTLEIYPDGHIEFTIDVYGTWDGNFNVLLPRSKQDVKAVFKVLGVEELK